jgi:hypothetical protein
MIIATSQQQELRWHRNIWSKHVPSVEGGLVSMRIEPQFCGHLTLDTSVFQTSVPKQSLSPNERSRRSLYAQTSSVSEPEDSQTLDLSGLTSCNSSSGVVFLFFQQRRNNQKPRWPARQLSHLHRTILSWTTRAHFLAITGSSLKRALCLPHETATCLSWAVS